MVRWSLLGVLLTLSSPAHAVRPFVTDDARIVDKGQFEAETWFEASRASGHWGPGAHAMLGFSFTSWFELIAGAGVTWRAEEGVRAADPVIQPKFLFLRAEEDGRPGVGMVVGTSLPTTRWRDADTRFSSFVIFPLTTRIAGDRLNVHVNVGARVTIAGDGTTQARPYWGVGLDVFLGHLDWRWIGEAYAGDPYEPDAPLVAGQTGVRWLHSDRLNLDLTFGVQPDPHGGRAPDLWAQLGIRILVDAARPRGDPGDPDGARGAFRYPRTSRSEAIGTKEHEATRPH